MKLNHYLHFQGTAEQAFTFYQSVFGGEFTYLSRFGEMPPQAGFELTDEQKNQLMHVSLQIGEHLELMGSDSIPGMSAVPFVQGNNHAISINVGQGEEDKAKQLFDALAVGGQVKMPLQVQFWGALFGTLTDKFGIEWMVNCPIN